MIRLDPNELEHLRKVSMLEQVQTVKRKYVKLGFVHQLALYGLLYNKETDKETYRRIDVMLNEPITQDAFTRIYDFFQVIKPPAPYSIWIYGNEEKEIAEVWHNG